jgi:hypothetical protein
VTAAVGAAVAAGQNGAAATDAAAGRAAKKEQIPFTKSDLFIELNATDGDAGLHLNLDGEDWSRLEVRDPTGRTLVQVKGTGRLRDHGLTGLTFESAEPPFTQVPFREFKARFPEGRYTFAGTTVDGRRLVGSDQFTHAVPQGPEVIAPTENAVMDPARLVVRWKPVPPPRGSEIVRYLVIVSAEATGRELSMELKPDATRALIPPVFLDRGAEHKVEVLARERGGNQTITEVPFRTRN